MNRDRTDLLWALDAVDQILAASLPSQLTTFSQVVADLVPHRAAIMRTPDCPREPVKLSGEAAITGPVTSVELSHLSELAVPGAAIVREDVIGGETRRIVLTESAETGAQLVLVTAGAKDPTESDLALTARLWNVVGTATARMADAVPADHIPSNLAIAAARSRAIADMEQTHATTLSAMLAVLRSRRLPDGTARRDAENLATNALLDLRKSSERDDELTAEAADDAFAVLADQLAPMARHGDTALDLSGPDDVRLLPRDLAHVARSFTHRFVLASLDRADTTRVRAAWRLKDKALQVTVRDDAPDAVGDPRTVEKSDERVSAIGGEIEVDSVPGWGTTVTAILPLDMGEPPAVGPVEDLHAREIEVLTGISEGLRNREIARRLNLSEHTVKFHVRNILAKLEVSSRGQAAALARDHLERPSRAAA
ncbi:helix-turn-helix transcriptional regulator [Salininema proteolyticum]|uniref:LuxR C-terminal-related transcriptional regulator n=1 Tax=Salininema proteolyticum TaxID=1607685 RepID=A0ABV8U1S5_9ACTN